MKCCALLLSLLVTLAGSPAWADDEYVPVRDHRYEIDVRIAALDIERSRISLTGPKVATWVSLAATVAGAIAFGVGKSRSNDCGDACSDGWGALATGRVLLPAAGIATIVSGVIWAKRVQRRNEIDAEIESLTEKRDGLAAALSRLELDGTYRNETHFVTLGLRF